jgi:uncharacterized protein YndB with AHSA1/START domain
MTVTASTVINAPADRIFAILRDPAQHPVIDGSGTVKGHPTGAAPLELGSEFGMDMKRGASYKTANTVVEFEPDRRIAWRHKAPHRWRYQLAPRPDGSTEVTETWDISYWPAVLRPGLNLLLGRKTQKGIEQTLVNLKAAAEKAGTDLGPQSTT